ncbi:unnamed protein product [Paramecium primaurelia]|uniref:Uncharacterized protein n=1 Tax=Paramecium primaurelia TaxID=5886 RepID=A0A8S1JR73_PARPR|nr:unnamed protein product [Paramecium primaurelia]CAD8044429.1 unnamed protein product [Paramecium primaurelia]
MSELYEMWQKMVSKITEERQQNFSKLLIKIDSYQQMQSKILKMEGNIEMEQKLDSSSSAGKYMPFIFKNLFFYLNYLATIEFFNYPNNFRIFHILIRQIKKYIEMINLNSTISVQKRNQSKSKVDIFHEEVEQMRIQAKRNEQRFNLYKNSCKLFN